MPAIASDASAGSLARSPGVYLQELLPVTAPPPPTGVPVFVGLVDAAGPPPQGRADGRVRQAMLVRPDELEPLVGLPWPDGYLGHAVRGFFGNGGRRCAVVAVARRPQDDAGALRAALASLFDERGALEDLVEADLVCVPDLMAGALRGAHEAVARVQRAALRHCSRMKDRFAILDCLPASAGDSVERRWVEQKRRLFDPLPVEVDGGEIEFANGALYGPWLRLASGLAVPPCGHVAGAFARTDAAAGPHASPANVVLDGVVDVEAGLDEARSGRLNDAGINCLRALPTRGVRIWGARTLAAPQSSARYVGVRRLLLALSRWLCRDMADLAFEPNQPALWAQVRQRVGAYCHALYRRGALRGDDSADAFFVKCDAETNPPEDREAGRLVCEIGLAALAPAEFIVVRLTRSGAAMTVSTT